MAKETLEGQIAAGERALAADAEREERIANCEMEFSDGFLSSWAAGLTAQKGRLAASILENGGTAWFWRAELVDAKTGEPIPAKRINGTYGLCWMLLDGAGNSTGQFVTAHPKRKATMERKGYAERITLFELPAIADLQGAGKGLAGAASVQAIIRPKQDGAEYIEWHGRAGANREEAEGWIEMQSEKGELFYWQEKVIA